MTAMVFDTVTQWACLAVAGLIYLECAVFVAFRHRDTERKNAEARRASLQHVPLLLCLGSMFVCSSTARLLRRHGASLSAATLAGMGFAVTAGVLAARSLGQRRGSSTSAAAQSHSDR